MKAIVYSMYDLCKSVYVWWSKRPKDILVGCKSIDRVTETTRTTLLAVSSHPRKANVVLLCPLVSDLLLVAFISLYVSASTSVLGVVVLGIIVFTSVFFTLCKHTP
jgi:hypothetical protein